MNPENNNDIIPAKERVKLRTKKIRALYGIGYSMDQICEEMKKLGQGVSKTTVFFAIKGRNKKKGGRKN